MDRPGQPRLHPLLLQQSYWRNRLQELDLTRCSLLMVPRPDLSSAFVDVEEFRARTYDGVRFWGLKARCLLRLTSARIRVRVVGPCDLPEIDAAVTDEGVIEYVYQELPGRRLEDRVLDAVRVARVAAQREQVGVDEIEFASSGTGTDEMRIAAQIIKLDQLE